MIAPSLVTHPNFIQQACGTVSMIPLASSVKHHTSTSSRDSSKHCSDEISDNTMHPPNALTTSLGPSATGSTAVSQCAMNANSDVRFLIQMTDTLLVDYPPRAHRVIVDAYKCGLPSVRFRLKVGKDKADYILQFSTMEQISVATQTRRPVILCGHGAHAANEEICKSTRRNNSVPAATAASPISATDPVSTGVARSQSGSGHYDSFNSKKEALSDVSSLSRGMGSRTRMSTNNSLASSTRGGLSAQMVNPRFQVCVNEHYIDFPEKAHAIICDAYRRALPEARFDLKVGAQYGAYIIDFSAMRLTSVATGTHRVVRATEDTRENSKIATTSDDGQNVSVADHGMARSRVAAGIRVSMHKSARESRRKRTRREENALTKRGITEEMDAMDAEKMRAEEKAAALERSIAEVNEMADALEAELLDVSSSARAHHALEMLKRRVAKHSGVAQSNGTQTSWQQTLQNGERRLRTIKHYEKLASAAKLPPSSGAAVTLNDDAIRMLDKAKEKCVTLGICGPLFTLHAELRANMHRQIGLQLIRAMRAKTADVKHMRDPCELNQLQEELVFTISACTQKHALTEDDVRPLRDRVRACHNVLQDLKGAIRVFLRARPFDQRDKDLMATQSVRFLPDKMTISWYSGEEDDVPPPGGSTKEIGDVDGGQQFTFDQTFFPGTQEEVFDEMSGLVQSIFDGYNVTVFAYGQTGSGKTYTMYGPQPQPHVNPGVALQCIHDIFRLKQLYEVADASPRGKSSKAAVVQRQYPLSRVTVDATMVQLYCSKLTDLFRNGDMLSAPKLGVKRTPQGEVTVENATVVTNITSANDLWAHVERGFVTRTTAATAMNSESSRSHLLLTIRIKVENLSSDEKLSGKLTLVDLAGSERVKLSNVEGAQMKEAIEINQSLTALGNVMEELTAGSTTSGGPSSKRGPVSFRNHILTQLLQDSLGGNAKTLMFANVSASSINRDETLMTCRWATRAKQVVNVAERAAAGRGSGAKKGTKGGSLQHAKADGRKKGTRAAR